MFTMKNEHHRACVRVTRNVHAQNYWYRVRIESTTFVPVASLATKYIFINALQYFLIPLPCPLIFSITIPFNMRIAIKDNQIKRRKLQEKVLGK